MQPDHSPLFLEQIFSTASEMEMEDSVVFERITALLDRAGVEYKCIKHTAVYTSKQAAQVRGTSLQSGAKAIMCKGESGLSMFVLPANRKLHRKRVRELVGWRKFRFATREEFIETSQLMPGTVPPFGSLFGLSTYCDQSLNASEYINFNAGHHRISISMRYDDYIRIEQPTVSNFSMEDKS